MVATLSCLFLSVSSAASYPTVLITTPLSPISRITYRSLTAIRRSHVDFRFIGEATIKAYYKYRMVNFWQ